MKQINSFIHINGKKAHKIPIPIHYHEHEMKGGEVNPKDVQGTPLVGTGYSKQLIPMLRPANDMSGGFLPLGALLGLIPAGIDLISGLFKGKGLDDYAQHCDSPGKMCDIEFKDTTGRGIHKTKMSMNNMHKALLLDHDFLRELEPALKGKGSDLSIGEGVGFGRGIGFPGGGTGLENINKV